MFWNATASVAMVGLGGAAVAITAMRGESKAIWLTLGYFTAMEGLQAAGYSVVDQCGSVGNRTITQLSYLHIVFQPLFLNAFAMAIAPVPVPLRMQRRVYALASVCSALMLLRLAPFDWAGVCTPGTSMCGDAFCTVSGTWHIAWQMPLNDLYGPLSSFVGRTVEFPDYFFAAFLLPLIYGAWRFVLFHLAAGPILAWVLTSNPDEMPAVWCLFAIGILMIGLSPFIRHSVMGAHRPVAAHA
ncbi:MAG: hypothetical protein HKN02_10120 [Rhodobacteraceae bacterium]|nr:hypothetical protein [Paracoccaceae bacterium]